MRRMPEVGIFKPTPSRTEAKSDVTTRTARAIVDTEATLRAAKTKRLRAARLAREAIEEPAAPVKKERRKR